MSADDTILIIPVLRRSRLRYHVARVQAAENFAEPSWTTGFVRGAQSFTCDLSQARRMAHDMDRQEPTEYGVRQLIYAVYA